MPAQFLLQPNQFYHGTASKLKVGQTLTPGGGESHHGTSEHVYMTGSRDKADQYAYDALRHEQDVPRTYVVEPHQQPEADPIDRSGTAWRTAGPVKVVKRLKHGVGGNEMS
jgi:hypothetical protein